MKSEFILFKLLLKFKILKEFLFILNFFFLEKLLLKNSSVHLEGLFKFSFCQGVNVMFL